MSKLIDKALEAAKAAVEKWENPLVPAVIRDWRLIQILSAHQVMVSVMVTAGEYEPFDIWVSVDLDTEEIVVQG